MGNKAKADAMYKEALEERQELWSNRELRKQVDRFTPGKSFTNLGNSLDTHLRFKESLKLREDAYNEFGTFELLDAWCWTCWKAGFYSEGYAEKKGHLTKSSELSVKLLELRPTNRGARKRWAFVLRDLGDLEFNQGNLAEAERHYARLVEETRGLATARKLAHQRQAYARAHYTLGRVRTQLGRDEEARKHFDYCRLIREELLRDYPDDPLFVHMRIDWLFSLVSLGEHAKAVAIADELCAKFSTDNNLLYRLTCIYSLSIPEVAQTRQPKALTAEDKALQARYRDKAVTCLEQALKHGNREYYNIRTDADLIPIRSDPRYQEILLKIKGAK
jgi:tetratricopeptide (TPR) repeat protein